MWIRTGNAWTHPEIPYVIHFRPATEGVPPHYEARSASDGEIIGVCWSLESAQARADEVWRSKDR